MGGGRGEDGGFEEGETDCVGVVQRGGDVGGLRVVVVVGVGGGEHGDVCGGLGGLWDVVLLLGRG